MLRCYDSPIDSVQNLFDAAGIQSVLTQGSPSTLTGYFSCSNPPTMGFGIPSTGNATAAAAKHDPLISHKSTVFNILPSQLISSQNGDNCTASIVGTDEFPFWLIGQGVYLLQSYCTPRRARLLTAMQCFSRASTSTTTMTMRLWVLRSCRSNDMFIFVFIYVAVKKQNSRSNEHILKTSRSHDNWNIRHKAHKAQYSLHFTSRISSVHLLSCTTEFS